MNPQGFSAGNINIPSSNNFSGLNLNQTSNSTASIGLSDILSKNASGAVANRFTPSQNTTTNTNSQQLTSTGSQTYTPQPTGLTQNDVMNNLTAAGYKIPSSIAPQDFKVPVSTQVDSSALGKQSPGAIQDALDAKRLALENGTNPNLIPSDQYLNQVVSNNPYQDLFNQYGQTARYSPEEIQAIQQKKQIQQDQLSAQLGTIRQLRQMQEDGTLTKEQAAGFISESQRRAADYQATLANNLGQVNVGLDTAAMMRQNALGAITGQFGMLQPTQVSPGSSLYNNITGVQYQGTGAAPDKIASLAQQMAQNDQSYGTLITNPDGSINQNTYYQRAQSLLSGGQGGTSGGSSTGMVQGGSSYQAPQPGTPQFAASLPPAVYPALQTTSTGMTYLDSSKLDATGIGAARQISKQTGVPLIDGQDAAAVKTTDQAIKNLKLLEANFNTLASGGVTGSLLSNATDPFAQFFQTERGSALSTYNNNRDGLLQQIRALAGSSPRINSQELNLAMNALPTLTEFNKDTLVTGQKKINTVMGYLNNALGTLIPGAGGQSNAASSQTVMNKNSGQTSGGNSYTITP